MLRRGPRLERGATMLEVLITMVVLAIGLLGLAGLQITSIQSNHGSYYRSQATVLAYDITDRMRSNRTAALAGEYAVNFPASATDRAVTGVLAQQDTAQWLNELGATLPGGTGRISTNDKLVTIEVRWNGSRGEIKDVSDSSAHMETFIYRTEI